MFFLNKAYGNIEFSNDDYPDSCLLPSPKSAILAKILKDYKFRDGVSEDDAFVIKNEYPKLCKGEMAFIADDHINGIVDYYKMTDDNKDKVSGITGKYYVFNGDLLLKHPGEYKDFIDELETTVLHDLYLLAKSKYEQLLEKYKHKNASSLKDLLDEKATQLNYEQGRIFYICFNLPYYLQLARIEPLQFVKHLLILQVDTYTFLINV